MASKVFLTLTKKIPLTQHVTSFVFSRPHNFTFYAGQYIRVFDSVSGESIFRDFTISSSPFDKDILTLTIKHGITEYKKTLFGMPIGRKFLVEAPMGRFYLDDQEERPQVFLAGGVGIAPFVSMIAYLTESKREIPLMLIASYSTPQDILFFSELESFQKQNPNLHVVYTISQPEKSQKVWSGQIGRISESLITNNVKNITIPQFLISGSPSFVSDMEDLLIGMGITLEQIRTEVFLGF